MKMVKSLLLGTAAGLLAVAGAQAADMPVKAKPVQYVKICSLYGDGFFYIPGTDICMKIGGYIRAQASYNVGISTTNGPFSLAAGQQTRLTTTSAALGAAADTTNDDYTWRTRAIATWDTRQQTEYGTLRTYLVLGQTADAPNAVALYANRAFIQFAGFTIGKASSFYDFYSGPAVSYNLWFSNGSDTGDGGYHVFAFTAQFGNGVTSTLSLEDPRRSTVSNASQTVAFTVGALPAANQNHVNTPDIVWNWRIDQAWGGFQVMGALHDASGGYYDTVAGGAACAGAAAVVGVTTGSAVCGHPANKMGWAAGAGIRLNAQGGSWFQAQVSYTQGAVRYISFTPGGAYSPNKFGVGNSLAFGWLSDGIFTNGGEVQLTEAWGFNMSYEHVFSPKWRTAIAGGYNNIRYNAVANAAICANMFAGGANTISIPLAQCNNNFSYWNAGVRTNYYFTPEFYAGIDVTYTKLNTSSKGANGIYTAVAGQARPTGAYTIQDEDSAAVTVRFHRDFKP